MEGRREAVKATRFGQRTKCTSEKCTLSPLDCCSTNQVGSSIVVSDVVV